MGVKSRWFGFGALVVTMVFVCSPGWAIDNQEMAKKPHEVREISVGVSVIFAGSESSSQGLSADQIRNDVEL